MSALPQSNSFSARLALAAGVAVTIDAPTLDDLAGVVARLQDKPAANEAKPAKPESKAPSPETAVGNASASTGAAASSAPPVVGGPEGEKRYTYDDVKNKVLALSKKSRELALSTLAQFKTVKGEPADHGNKLQLADYAAFIAAADKALGNA